MNAHAQPVVAIDGPAASGKSSTALAVARALGWGHLDSGALYRAITRVALDLGGPGCAAEDILRSAEARGLELRAVGPEHLPWLDGVISAEIRTPEVTANVSAVSAMKPVREWVNARLRRAVARTGSPVVMDGRDIGTAVFPNAAVKVFLIASPEVRARRRLLERGNEPHQGVIHEEAARLAARDAADAARPVAPLRQAEDAVILDTTGLRFDEQVARIVALVHQSHLWKEYPGR